MGKVQGEGEIRISAEWGRDSDSNIHIGASGRVCDERGNYLKVDATQEITDGEIRKGSGSIAAGHEEK